MRCDEKYFTAARLPLFEQLEERRMLSATVLKHAGAAVPKPALHAAHLGRTLAHKNSLRTTANTKSVTPAPSAVAWNDVYGTWTGTFKSDGKDAKTGTISAVFQPRWIASNTGTINVTSLAGQSVLTTVTPDAAGNVLAYLPLKNGGSVSIVGGLSYSGKMLSGRWGMIVGTIYTTGTFQMTRP